MNKIFYLGFLLIASTAIAQEPVSISSKVESVTVYPSGARIERTGAKFLSSGRQVLVFEGLASELDPSSVSVSADGNISVLSVSTQTNYLKPNQIPKNVRALQDSLRSYEFDLEFNQNMGSVFEEERKMILANQKIGWEKTEFIIEDLEDLSDFYRDRLADIMLKQMELRTKKNRLDRNIRRLRAQLNEHNNKLNRSTGEIIVEVNVPSNANANFTLAYMVRNAGWVPAYNVNVSEVDEPLQVSYNAKVHQNTGVDWSNVMITLTNANPNLNGNKPEIHPWRLYFINQPVAYQELRMSNKAYSLEAPQAMSADDAGGAEAVELGATIDYPVNEAVTQFSIKTRHNVPSNGKPQVINIDVFTVPARYAYYCAPKVDPSAFLIAKVSGFEQYDLLPGQANLFLANTYVGQAYINPGVITDTLDLSLGRDQSLIVKRQKIKEMSDSKKIGNSTKESMGIEVSVRNTKSTKIKLVIEDQIPISSDKDIEVSLDEAKGAKHDQVTGTLRWSKVIMGNSSESVTFRYGVKYPSDKKINL